MYCPRCHEPMTQAEAVAYQGPAGLCCENCWVAATGSPGMKNMQQNLLPEHYWKSRLTQEPAPATLSTSPLTATIEY